MNKIMKPANSYSKRFYYFLFLRVFKMIPLMVKIGIFLLVKARGDLFKPEKEFKYKSIYEEGWLG